MTEDSDASHESRGVEAIRVPVGRDLGPAEPVLGVCGEGETTIPPVFEEMRLFGSIRDPIMGEEDQPACSEDLRRGG